MGPVSNVQEMGHTTRAVHTRLHEQCTPGYTSSAHQATRAVHTRLHEQCTQDLTRPGYTSSAHKANGVHLSQL